MEKNYSEANYQEDKRLTYFVIKNFCNVKLIEDYEQFYNDCLFDLFKARQLYNAQKGKYSTFACRFIINCYLRSLCDQNLKKNKLYLNLLSLDEPISNLDIPIGDTIGCEMQIDDIGVNKLIDKILQKQRQDDYRFMIKHFLDGYNMVEIAKLLNCSHTHVSNHINRFRAELRQELAKVGYEI